MTMKRLKRTDTAGFTLACVIPFVLVGVASFVGIGRWLTTLEWKLAVSIPVGVVAGVVGTMLFKRYQQWKLYGKVNDRAMTFRRLLLCAVKNEHDEFDYYKIATVIKIVVIGIPSVVLIIFAGEYAFESYQKYRQDRSAEKQEVVRRGLEATESADEESDESYSPRGESLADLEREIERIELERLSDLKLLQSAFATLPPAIAMYSIDNGVEMDVSAISRRLASIYSDRLRRLSLKYAEGEQKIAVLTVNAVADLASAGVLERSLSIMQRMDRLVDFPGRNVTYSYVLFSYTRYRSMGVSNEGVMFLLEQEFGQ